MVRFEPLSRHGSTGPISTAQVRYTDRVDVEKQQSMTPSICFEFCRTVPDMLHFGLVNGRDCYCAPYYTQDGFYRYERCPYRHTGTPVPVTQTLVHSRLYRSRFLRVNTPLKALDEIYKIYKLLHLWNFCTF